MSTLEEQIQTLGKRHGISESKPEDTLSSLDDRLKRLKKKEALLHRIASLQEQIAVAGDLNDLQSIDEQLSSENQLANVAG